MERSYPHPGKPKGVTKVTFWYSNRRQSTQWDFSRRQGCQKTRLKLKFPLILVEDNYNIGFSFTVEWFNYEALQKECKFVAVTDSHQNE